MGILAYTTYDFSDAAFGAQSSDLVHYDANRTSLGAINIGY